MDRLQELCEELKKYIDIDGFDENFVYSNKDYSISYEAIMLEPSEFVRIITSDEIKLILEIQKELFYNHYFLNQNRSPIL